MVMSTFSLLDKNGKEKLFEKTFLLANVSLHIVFFYYK